MQRQPRPRFLTIGPAANHFTYVQLDDFPGLWKCERGLYRDEPPSTQNPALYLVEAVLPLSS